MKQQAGMGILLALTTAMCWGALPIAMKQVLEVMEPPTVVFYRFLMASIGPVSYTHLTLPTKA